SIPTKWPRLKSNATRRRRWPGGCCQNCFRRRTMRAEQVADITLTINGESRAFSVPVRRNLVDYLRHDVGMTGSHVGCEAGICGACYVRVDGVVVRGCLIFGAQDDCCVVDTLEGITVSSEAADLQQAVIERNALQCGYCTP